MNIRLIIPTYNEVENLPRLIQALFDLPLADLNLLFVDDNSPDGTGKLIDEYCQKFPGKVDVIHRSGKLGLGSAYIAGFLWCLEHGAEAIGQMDADFSHPLDKISALAEALSSCDVAIGSRYVKGGALDERWPFWRKWLSGFGNFYARTILTMPIRDVTGGFKLWKRETLVGMPLERVKSNGYVFQVEMNYVAMRLGYTFREIPIYFSDRTRGKSKMSFRIQVEAAVRVWKLLFAYPDLPRLIRG